MNENEKNFNRRLAGLGCLIERQMKAERFTNAELRRRTGLTDQTIINIRQGSGSMLSSIMAICDVIGLDICITDRKTGEMTKI